MGTVFSVLAAGHDAGDPAFGPGGSDGAHTGSNSGNSGSGITSANSAVLALRFAQNAHAHTPVYAWEVLRMSQLYFGPWLTVRHRVRRANDGDGEMDRSVPADIPTPASLRERDAEDGLGTAAATGADGGGESAAGGSAGRRQNVARLATASLRQTASGFGTSLRQWLVAFIRGTSAPRTLTAAHEAALAEGLNDDDTPGLTQRTCPSIQALGSIRPRTVRLIQSETAAPGSQNEFRLAFVYDSVVPCRITVYPMAREVWSKNAAVNPTFALFDSRTAVAPVVVPAGLGQVYEMASSIPNFHLLATRLPAPSAANSASRSSTSAHPDASAQQLSPSSHSDSQHTTPSTSGTSSHAFPMASNSNTTGPNVMHPLVIVCEPITTDRDLNRQISEGKIADAVINYVSVRRSTSSERLLDIKPGIRKMRVGGRSFILHDIYGYKELVSMNANPQSAAAARSTFDLLSSTRNQYLNSESTPEDERDDTDREADEDEDDADNQADGEQQGQQQQQAPLGESSMMFKECVICLTDTRDTILLPCRHLCLCSECAEALRLQSNKCPVCRQTFAMFIKVDLGDILGSDTEDVDF
ncbi:hypothetical protein GQ42DRAFT_173750 [Ramicandelaber brevisporus]|nr:hypothetical protein GQ42DRAFT_173750 [Ramicandelaber brevisporus]